MRLSREVVLAHAEETGFRPATLEKVLRLAELLAAISRHSFLESRLVLKGGTAIQLALGAPKRLSVDLDFNYVGTLDRSAMLADRPRVEREIMRVAASHQYRVRRSREEHAGRKFHLEYRSHAGVLDRIEIDVNFLNRLPLDEPQSRRVWQPPGVESPTCRVVADEELWAGKIAALLDRSLPRDLFDVAMLAERSPRLIGDARFRALAIAWCGVLDHALHTHSRRARHEDS